MIYPWAGFSLSDLWKASRSISAVLLLQTNCSGLAKFDLGPRNRGNIPGSAFGRTSKPNKGRKLWHRDEFQLVWQWTLASLISSVNTVGSGVVAALISATWFMGMKWRTANAFYKIRPHGRFARHLMYFGLASYFNACVCSEPFDSKYNSGSFWPGTFRLTTKNEWKGEMWRNCIQTRFDILNVCKCNM